ncbi:MAG: RNA-dependent RNA polymerase [Bactrocera latifrons orthophasmavirus]|nr:MAG: RNA-dependent RNA polymerase [Bactrocera latifrons orthophasmavirus]
MPEVAARREFKVSSIIEMDKILKYKTKKERIEENVPQYERYKAKLVSTTPIHTVINGLTTLVQENMTPTVALSQFKNAQNARHDNWCEYLTRVSKIDGFRATDTKVKDFNNTLLGHETWDPPQDSIAKLSPDILTMDNDKRVMYVGDVTVTNSVGAAQARKHEKYKCISLFYRNLGFTVIHVDFILNEDLSNFSSVMNKFVRNGFMIEDIELSGLYQSYSLACNSLMRTFRDNCVDKVKFDSLLSVYEKMKDDVKLITKPPAELMEIDTTPYKPIRSESEIIKMIKDHIEMIDLNEYFTTDIARSISALQQLIDNNLVHEHMQPKSTLKVIDNSKHHEFNSNHNLVLDYLEDLDNVSDNETAQFIIHLIPNYNQLIMMKNIVKSKLSQDEVKACPKYKENLVYGPYQYMISSKYCNSMISNYGYQLKKGKSIRNDKESPKTIDLNHIQSYVGFMNESIEYYGSQSLKPSALDNSWDASTRFEYDNSAVEREMYNYVKTTNGVQLCFSMAQLHNRLTHLSTTLSTKDNIFIPPNGSFICIIPKEHAPMSNKSVDLPLIFITRSNIVEPLTHIEYESYVDTDRYRYYVSKLSRLNVSKMANWSNAGYKLVATSTYLLSRCSILESFKVRVVGLLTYLTLDVHQKISEFLDLLKYISFMPFSDISRLPELIKDKMDLLIKTQFDGWMIYNIKTFINELGKIPELNAVKPKLRLFNTAVVPDSLGIKLKLPSFINPMIRHREPDSFIEEINMLYTIRPKQLYGSQFMDKSITDTCTWNNEYNKECEEHRGWATVGNDDFTFPFESKFCYSADAIVYAEQYLQQQYVINKNKVAGRLDRSVYTDYMHSNCSLRGCTKDRSDRLNSQDIHTTSLDACLHEYKKMNYDDEKCKSSSFAYRFMMSDEFHEYSMSEKEQRGGGRPISTPTLGTKAALMMLEKPEAAKGQDMLNNIIVPGKNKLQAQCETYKTALADGSRKGYKHVYQLTEDQTKYSENDNPRKFEYYIRNNTALSDDVKALQMHGLKGLYTRRHLVKRIPLAVKENPNLYKYVIDDSASLGVKAHIGWPQGMLNFISTNVHCGADLWITKAYNEAYPLDKVYTRGLVHSDDSWVVVCCNNINDFKRFTLFRTYAKKLFCLKLNQKKLWGSKYLGELVSNYNLNGNVHLSVSKTLANSFTNLTFQNWPIDVHNQISAIQQCYRNGANVGTLIMLSTILRQQMIQTYQVKGLQLELLTRLPIDIGGYPACSAFELGVCGVTSHYRSILQDIKRNPDSKISKIIQVCIEASQERHLIKKISYELGMHGNNAREMMNQIQDCEWKDEDYENLTIPSRGDVFKAIKHIMPKSNKLAKTLESIRNLPFESNGLEMIVIRAKTLEESLGHLKSRTSSMLYQMATEKYTQSIRRLAISQTIQSSGKVVRLGDLKPMTFNELYEVCLLTKINRHISVELIACAFSDDNELIDCAHSVVHASDAMTTIGDKRKIINVMPEIEDKFSTVGRLSEVLLTIIDSSLYTNYLNEYAMPNVGLDTLQEDAQRIRLRFNHYFRYHEVIYACSLIMQQYKSAIKSRIWTQPKLRNDNLLVFLEDLYGKTISSSINYIITTNLHGLTLNSMDRDIVQTIYCTMILNKMYDDKFKIDAINDVSLSDAIKSVDYQKLNNNDLLKYGVCCYVLLNNQDYLDKYITMNNYVQNYIEAQTRTNRGYVGKFKVICRLGNVVAVFTGEPGEMHIEVNRPDVPGLLKLMRMFTNTNFNPYRYLHDGGWGSSALWNSTTILSNLYLVYYTCYSTVISSGVGSRRIPITINSNLRYGSDIDTAPPLKYEFEGLYRVVKAFRFRGSQRVGNIFQNFSLPLRKVVRLDPDYIDNIDNQILYSSGIIEASILNNVQCVNISLVKTILMEHGVMSFLPVGMVYLHIMSSILKQENEWAYERISDISEIETTDIYNGISMGDIIEIADTTEIENLESICVDYVATGTTMQGKIYINQDLRGMLSRAFTGQVTINRRNSFLYHIITNQRMIDWMKQIKADMAEGVPHLDDIYDYISEATMEVDLNVYAFILSTELDKRETWDTINLKEIYKHKELIDYRPDICKLALDFLTMISISVYGEDTVEVETIFSSSDDES